METGRKERIDVMQARSLRDLVNQINRVNSSSGTKIMREDIVSLTKDEDTYFMLYYK